MKKNEKVQNQNVGSTHNKIQIFKLKIQKIHIESPKFELRTPVRESRQSNRWVAIPTRIVTWTHGDGGGQSVPSRKAQRSITY